MGREVFYSITRCETPQSQKMQGPQEASLLLHDEHEAALAAAGERAQHADALRLATRNACPHSYDVQTV